MPLRKEDIERIEREAEENYSALFNCSNAAYTANEVVQNCINSYTAGAKAEAEKANELVEALVELMKWCEPDESRWNYMSAIEHAKQAISNYKK